MPGLLDDTREIMLWIASNISRDTYINVINQYYPAHKAETEPRFADINRSVTADEFCGALQLARGAGLWRFDTRWRRVIPHGAPVWLPRIHEQASVDRN
jgi:putative pyruvate formate lyase activating enzyme